MVVRKQFWCSVWWTVDKIENVLLFIRKLFLKIPSAKRIQMFLAFSAKAKIG